MLNVAKDCSCKFKKMLFFLVYMKVLEIKWYAVLLSPIMDFGNAGNCHWKGIDNC